MPRLGALGADHQKKSLSASERDEAARQAWRLEMASRAAERLVFVDECGTHTSLTPLYARAPKGQRAVGKVPRNRGTVTSFIAALTLGGLAADFAVEGAVSGDVFVAYTERVLVPSLKPGDVVVMDRLGAHRRAEVRRLIEGAHCQLVFLPSYSPDFSPIEEAFSKLKTLLRRSKARTREALLEAIARALEAVTPQDARGWFQHCGYHPPAQSA